MEPLLERLPVGGRIAVIRLRSLGDCVLTTPALQILKEARPDLHLTVVVESRFAAVFEDNPHVAAILPPTLSAVASSRPDLAINFHGGPRSVALTLASRAQYRAGFAHYRAPWAYNVRLPRAQEVLGVERPVHTAEHLASAMFHLGVRKREIPRASLSAAPSLRARPYVVIHPFASSAEKTWPACRFVTLARELRDHGGLEVIVLSGPGGDPSAFSEFDKLQNAPLAQVKSVLHSASLFVGNDSGPAHMAAALGVPVIVLFGASDAAVWAPWKPVAAETLARSSISEIEIDQVLRAVEQLRVRA